MNPYRQRVQAHKRRKAASQPPAPLPKPPVHRQAMIGHHTPGHLTAGMIAALAISGRVVDAMAKSRPGCCESCRPGGHP